MQTRFDTAIEPAPHKYRREALWAWLSLVTLLLCWDASLRLDTRVSPPRVRIAHAGETVRLKADPQDSTSL